MSTLVFHWFQQLKQLVHLSSFPRNILQEYLACCMVPLLTEGISPHPEFMLSQLPQQVYNTITKYSIVIGLVVIAESDDSCP